MHGSITHPRYELSDNPVEPRETDVTLLFCDVVRSTELTRTLGDRGAYRVIRHFHDVVVRASRPFDGEQIELRGDGILLAFRDPRSALSCAVEIETNLFALPDGLRITVRIGIHAGPALRTHDGYFGVNVILSSRIAAEAAPGEILVSDAIVQRVADSHFAFDAGRWVSLKGVPAQSLVFAVPWQPIAQVLPNPNPTSVTHDAVVRALDRSCEPADEAQLASCILEREVAV